MNDCEKLKDILIAGFDILPEYCNLQYFTGNGFNVQFFIENKWSDWIFMSTNFYKAQSWIYTFAKQYAKAIEHGIPWYDDGGKK